MRWALRRWQCFVFEKQKVVEREALSLKLCGVDGGGPPSVLDHVLRVTRDPEAEGRQPSPFTAVYISTNLYNILQIY